MNNRRNLLIVLGAGVCVPAVAFAQAKKAPVVIGWLGWASRALSESNRETFRNELASLGWRAGAQVLIEERFADGNADRLTVLAEELASKKPALIVAQALPAGRAAAKAAPKTPIVVIGGDPVAAGLVASYARPGGMMTGVSGIRGEFTGKFLELLLAAVPKVRRVGFLLNSSSGAYLQHKENVRTSVAQFAVESRTAEIARVDEVESALVYLAKEGVQALIAMSEAGPFATERQRIIKFALVRGWPVIGGAFYADDGALVSYAAALTPMYRRAAYLVDRILMGAKPAALPIERAMSFELVVNLKTAKALGLTMPPEIMVRATRVIE